MMDIDHFKAVNDTYGHGAGDAVLRDVARALADAFPERAIVSRFGGEEFCVLTSLAPGEPPARAFDALRARIESATTHAEGVAIRVTISIGVACGVPDLNALIKLADDRLYAAKNSGRNRVVDA